ncbi:hypothetical protein ABZ915_35590 [Streptomyces sp. NPDC046915]|uniref:hypothetical protein n=1 Tax=Streptomyces sp. NPDC046915 TaxID=3155257 RepID=UPI0033C7345E
MITHSDDGPDFEPDDPLAVILRPPSEHLAAPPGRFEEIRRTAGRRRVLRAAVGVGASCAVAAVLALPFLRTSHEPPASPVVPLAPPPASSPSGASSPSAAQSPSVPPGRGHTTAPSPRPTPRPTATSPTRGRGATEKVPTSEPSRSPSAPSSVPDAEPSVGPERTSRAQF